MTIIMHCTLDLIIKNNQAMAKTLDNMLKEGKAEMKKTKSGINYLKIYDHESNSL